MAFAIQGTGNRKNILGCKRGSSRKSLGSTGLRPPNSQPLPKEDPQHILHVYLVHTKRATCRITFVNPVNVVVLQLFHINRVAPTTSVRFDSLSVELTLKIYCVGWDEVLITVGAPQSEEVDTVFTGFVIFNELTSRFIGSDFSVLNSGNIIVLVSLESFISGLVLVFGVFVAV